MRQTHLIPLSKNYDDSLEEYFRGNRMTHKMFLHTDNGNMTDEKEIDFNGPITSEMIEEIKRRNEEKLKKAKEYLGNKWICHPDHAVHKKPQKVKKHEEDQST